MFLSDAPNLSPPSPAGVTDDQGKPETEDKPVCDAPVEIASQLGELAARPLASQSQFLPAPDADGTRFANALSNPMADEDLDDVRKAFAEAVNMPPARLKKWLEREESREVGWADGEPKSAPGGKESVGHHSGRRIVEIKRKKKADLTDDDLAHMRKVVGYVHRHLVQRPEGDISHTRWRYSLMNWGHDPLTMRR